MKFAVIPHQRKDQPYIDALTGWEQVEIGEEADLLLTNSDLPHGGWRKAISGYRHIGAKIVTYPDGGLPYLWWDGIHLPWKVDATTVIAPGHAEVLRRYGCSVPAFVSGWAWSDIRKFSPVDNPRRVLFAPLHPDGYGWLSEANLMANRHVFEALLKTDFEITIRHLGKIEQNGLELVPGVVFKRGRYDNSFTDILNADVIISAETFAYAAVALGKPTVMMARSIELFQQAAHYADYADYLAYPLTFDRGDDLEALIYEASFTNPEDWKDRFIGWSFDQEKFAAWIDSLYVKEPA